jgi:sec-independent protein translocase protein TatA
MIGDIGLPELALILAVALVFFGPGKLPDLGKAFGEALRGFKKAINESDGSSQVELNDKTLCQVESLEKTNPAKRNG